MSTQNAVASALYTTLSTGTALTNLLALGTKSIFHIQAGTASAYPCVVFSLQAGGPLNLCPTDMRDLIYFVRGYSKTSALNAGSIDAQISTLLHHGTLSVTGYTNYRIDRETDFSTIENTPADDQIWMSGAFYRIRLDT